MSYPSDPIARTTSPSVTGASVIGVKYRDGVLIAADTHGAYGGLLRYKDFRRVASIGTETIIGSGGDLSDYQEIVRLLREKEEQDYVMNDGAKFLKARQYASFLTRTQYQKRNKMDPLYTFSVIGGVDHKEKFLATVDLYGNIYEGNYVMSGTAHYFANTLLYERWRPDLSLEEAKKLVEECFKVIFYRDTKASDSLQFAIATARGVHVEEPYVFESNWEHPEYRTYVNERILGMRFD